MSGGVVIRRTRLLPIDQIAHHLGRPAQSLGRLRARRLQFGHPGAVRTPGREEVVVTINAGLGLQACDLGLQVRQGAIDARPGGRHGIRHRSLLCEIRV